MNLGVLLTAIAQEKDQVFKHFHGVVQDRELKNLGDVSFFGGANRSRLCRYRLFFASENTIFLFSILNYSSFWIFKSKFTFFCYI